MKRFTKLFVWSICLLTAITLLGCPEGGDTIKIGVAGAHSGDLASYGIPTVNAAQLVVDEINKNGGVLGRTVELVVEDEECAPEIATNVATKLVGEGVVGVIGHICSGATRAALPAYAEAGVIVISPSATNPSLTKDGLSPNFFRTIAPDDLQGEVLANFALDNLNARSFVVLHDKGDYGKGLAEFSMGYLSADSRADVRFIDGITPEAVDYSAIINRIANENVDAVIFGGYHPEASKLVKQIRDRGLDIDFLSGDGVKDEAFIALAQQEAEGVYASGPIDTSDNPLAQVAISSHNQNYGGEPGPFYLNGYAATIALLNAIEVAGSTDYDEVRAALQSEYVDTPVGSISFNQNGDAIGVGFSVFQVENGKYKEL